MITFVRTLIELVGLLTQSYIPLLERYFLSVLETLLFDKVLLLVFDVILLKALSVFIDFVAFRFGVPITLRAVRSFVKSARFLIDKTV